MHGTGILLGMHGADFGNILFMPVGCKFFLFLFYFLFLYIFYFFKKKQIIAAMIEINPYRFYDNRFFGVAPLCGVGYFSYNCGTRECAVGWFPFHFILFYFILIFIFFFF